MKSIPFYFLIILYTVNVFAYYDSDAGGGSPISTPSFSSLSFKSTYSPSDSSDSRASRSKSLTDASSMSPSDLSATESENTGPGRTIAPGNAKYHEKMHPYYEKKSRYHKVTHDYYKADKKETRFANLHNDEATSSYKKARKHKVWEEQVKSGKMQPGKKTLKDVPDCPPPPCCKGNANCIRKNKNYQWPHKKNSRRLLPVEISERRAKRVFESDESNTSSSPKSSSRSPSPARPFKRKKN